MTEEKIDYEKSIKEIEKILIGIEEGKLSLDDSIKAFERATRLINFCQNYLNSIEKKIEFLTQNKEK